MVNINDEYEIGFIVSNVRFTLTCNEKLSLPKNQIFMKKIEEHYIIEFPLLV